MKNIMENITYTPNHYFGFEKNLKYTEKEQFTKDLKAISSNICSLVKKYKTMAIKTETDLYDSMNDINEAIREMKHVFSQYHQVFDSIEVKRKKQIIGKFNTLYKGVQSLKTLVKYTFDEHFKPTSESFVNQYMPIDKRNEFIKRSEIWKEYCLYMGDEPKLKNKQLIELFKKNNIKMVKNRGQFVLKTCLK